MPPEREPKPEREQRDDRQDEKADSPVTHWLITTHALRARRVTSLLTIFLGRSMVAPGRKGWTARIRTYLKARATLARQAPT
jgi:hypothetical protein